ncbi:MAG: PEP-CTERM sorting domain-containing protein [Scytolyngbya sp. HA4215-MV1]|jgi:hypothetical protein|nr:PEP-CTERM sorting domain-containing protein [Scytolyngbya sp. HA4215-MV1]
MKSNFVTAGLGLAAGAAMAFSAAPAHALTFGNTGTFSFESNTTVDFTFVLSKGMWQSSFGVYDVAANTLTKLLNELKPGYDPGSGDSKTNPSDWLGTCGKTVTTCSNSFTFLAGKAYQFFLTGSPTQYSSSSNTVFTYNGASTTFKSSGPTYNKSNTPILMTLTAPSNGALIRMNDAHSIDVDTNDFIVTAVAHNQPVPEPTTLMGLGAVAGSFLMSRRRKVSESTEA